VQAKWSGEPSLGQSKREPGCGTDMMMTSHRVLNHLNEHGPWFLRSRNWMFRYMPFI